VVSAINGKQWLYNLAIDKSETTDLSAKDPGKVKELETALAEWEIGLGKPLWPGLMHYEFVFVEDEYFVDL